RRFESVRGLCKSAAYRRLFCRRNLHNLQRAVGKEPFMELPGPERRWGSGASSPRNVPSLARGLVMVESIGPYVTEVRLRWDDTVTLPVRHQRRAPLVSRPPGDFATRA